MLMSASILRKFGHHYVGGLQISDISGHRGEMGSKTVLKLGCHLWTVPKGYNILLFATPSFSTFSKGSISGFLSADGFSSALLVVSSKEAEGEGEGELLTSFL